MSTPHDPQSVLHHRLLAAMSTVLGDKLPDNADPLLGPARDPKFGDFQSNAAMPLGKASGINPRELAQQLIDALDVGDIAEAPGIAGPGFINFRLKAEALTKALEAIDNDSLGIPELDQPSTVVVDLCGVNLAKQMHVGHLRATVIGDALARLHERLGYTVKRQNHFGDWGLPIAMVTRAIHRRLQDGALDLDRLELEGLEQLYRDAQRECAPDRRGLDAVNRYALGPKAQAELEEQVEGAMLELEAAKKALVALQSGDEQMLTIWRRICEVTLDACFANCGMLGAEVNDAHTAGESTYSEDLAPLVDDLESRGIAEPSDGALIVRLDELGIKEPLLVRKSDGGFLYATTDLSAIRRRVDKLEADRVIYAVDARQGLHFRQVFAASRRAGYAQRDGRDVELIHAAFGTVLGEDGRPFKTRSGENVKLSDLLEEAVRRADHVVTEKNPELAEDERREIAWAVGIGAIKYADLSTERIKDYVFAFDRMLAFEGNTGPYLQYAAVRVASIFRKAESEHGIAPDADLGAFALDEPEEKAIALQLLRYAGVVESAAESCEPHRLCTYLYELASAFSTFFNACPVLKAPDESTRNSRLRLCRLTGNVLRDGLRSIGIAPLEKM